MLPDVFSSCDEHLKAVGVFVNAGESTMREAAAAAAALTASLPASHVMVSSDVAPDAEVAVILGKVKVMIIPEDDDADVVASYGSRAPWKKAQSRFPHALAAAVSALPADVKWIISQDTDTALNIPAIASLLASHDFNDKIVFGCMYEHVRDARKGPHHGGGAGMLFSRAAAEAIVQSWRASLPHSAPRYPRTA
jgi:hypothetical protein